MQLAHDPGALLAASQALCDALRERGWRLATAESCTGGGVAHAVTDIAGSSDVFDRGFVTYSNDAKIEMLAVDATLLARHGAVSQPVALAMADGALRASRADLAVAITGVAGPGGGTPDKPVGTVCFAWATLDGERASTTHRLDGDRASVRAQSVAIALEGLVAMAGGRRPA
ncbi:MAG: nicotinamide-nucleotide amidohydrolase family protein [Betaproteobacteria bacterium]